MPERSSGIILAGGQSMRMGCDKAHLAWGGVTLLEHIVETLRGVVSEVLVVVKDARSFGHLPVRVVEDLVPGMHALGGLYTGLSLAINARCFVSPCDAPFLNARLIRWLLEQADGYDAVVPRTPQGLQPLHAVYAKSALPIVAEQLQARCWSIKRLADRVRTNVVDLGTIRVIDPVGRSFVNLNTPHDYALAISGRNFCAV